MRCEEILTRPAEYVLPEDTARIAALKMSEANVGFLPVCDPERDVVGVITDRDLAVRVLAEGLPPTTPVVRSRPRNHDAAAHRYPQEVAHPSAERGRMPIFRRQRALDSVLVATDFSAGAATAVERAARLPLAPQARIDLMHVLSARVPREFQATAEAQARRLLDEATVSARTAAAKVGNTRVAVVPVTACGRASVEIVQQARCRAAALIVIGRHGHRPVRDLLIGSTAERVVRQSERPVLVVNAKPLHPYRHPLVAVDLTGDSRLSQSIIDLALALADLSVSRLRLVHAYEVPFEGWLRPDLPPDALRDYRREWKDTAARELIRLQQRLTAPGVRLLPALRPGEPPLVIGHEATRHKTDLVVLGTHGRSGIAHVLLGSVAAWVLRSVSCDVAIRRPPELTYEAP